MKLLTESECLAWLKSHGINTGESNGPAEFINEVALKTFSGRRYTLPADSSKKVALARALFWQWKPTAPILVWLRNWMVWPSSSHIPLILTLRQGMGGSQSLEDAPVHLFESVDVDHAVSLLIISLISSWDCFITDGTGSLFFFLSHDDYFTLVSRDASLVNRLGAVFESAKWCRQLTWKKPAGGAAPTPSGK